MDLGQDIETLVSSWRNASKKQFKLNRIKQLIIDSKNNKKPSEYDPEDFIPRVPEYLRIKYSQEQANYAATSSKQAGEKENQSPTVSADKTNQNESKTKLNTSKKSTRSRIKSLSSSSDESPPKQVQNDSSVKSKNESTSSMTTRSRRTLVDANNSAKPAQNASKQSRIRSLSSSSTDEQAAPTSVVNESSKLIANSILTSMKKRRKPISIDRINRLIEDSKNNKKPSDYEPEDFIKPITAEMREALQARLNSINKSQESSMSQRASRKSTHESMKQKSLLADLAEISNESRSDLESEKSIELTPIKNKTTRSIRFQPSRSQSPVSVKHADKSTAAKTITKSKIEESVNSNPGTSRSSKRIQLQSLPLSSDSDSIDDNTTKKKTAASPMRRSNGPITPIRLDTNLQPHVALEKLDESLVMERKSTRGRSDRVEALRRSEQYKMSSTANTSNALQFTFNNADLDMQSTKLSNQLSSRKPSRAKGIALKKKPLKKIEDLSDEDETIIVNAQNGQDNDSPAKQAFDNSIRRKSNHMSLLAENVDQLNELDNDEIVVGSGELYGQLSKAEVVVETAQEPINTPVKKKSLSKIEITKIPRRVAPLPDIASSTPAVLPPPPPPAPARDEKSPEQQSQVENVIKELEVSINMKQKKKKSSHQQRLSELKNRTLANEEDELELASAQSNLFLKKSNTKSINSTGRSINSSKTSNHVTSLFKPIDQTPVSTSHSTNKNAFLVPELPAVPVPAVAATAAVTSPASEEQQQSLVYEMSVATIFSPKSNESIVRTIVKPEPVKQAKKRELVDSEDEQPNSSPPQKENPIVKAKSKSGRPKKQKPLQTITNKMPLAASSQPSTSKKANEEALKSNKKLNLKGLTKRGINPEDKRRETIYEIKPVEEDSEQNGLRRSKRTKVDHQSVPVYRYDEIIDYAGNRVIVSKLVGTRKRVDKYSEFMTKHEVELKKRKKMAQQKKIKPNSSNNSSGTERTADSQEIEPPVQNEFDSAPLESNEVPNDTVDKRDPIHIQCTQDSSIKFSSHYNDSALNMSQETVLFENEDSNVSEQTAKRKVFCFKNQVKNKQFESCYPGVGLHVMSKTGGLLCVDSMCSTQTQKHPSDVVYTMQMGEACIMSLSGSLSKHTEGDIIEIPAEVSYKIKNISKASKAYFHFRFV